MKFLYGDSEPFPLQYDFLKTLQSFMTSATRVVQLEAESALAEIEAQRAVETQLKLMEGLEGFHAAAVRVLQEAAARAGHQVAQEYATALCEQGNKMVEERKRAAQAAADRSRAAATQRDQTQSGDVRKAFEEFFRSVRVPTVGTEVTYRLGEGTPELLATFAWERGIIGVFTLPLEPGWSAARRVSEFATELTAKVGVKKKFLRDEVIAETEKLDDYFVSSFELRDQQAIIRLRRKADQPDGLVFKLTRNRGRAACQVEHPGDHRADALPSTLDQEDVATLEKFWLALLNATRELLERREHLRSLKVDRDDVFTTRAGTEVVNRLVQMFGPTVVEIAKRSPNAHELTLKVESTDGKREELYLRKGDLLKKLQPLPATGRAVFEPLGLSQWVPAVTPVGPPPLGNVPPITEVRAGPPPILRPGPTDPGLSEVTDITRPPRPPPEE